ncbi:unnamed protein product [Eruca vesicaria subsp. sativa]|uniref:Uncharacterized protein n=1 Tax=Eruca vesicaria subsp. sativa TaxID=29727 RepID=A0ABC8LV86_ERUVS|nr:unnamed protein product [Eruca vesicaria subsp. sativa]
MMYSPKTKPYPIGREHPRKQLPDCTKIRCPLSMLDHRVHFLINKFSDLDNAANHACLAVRKNMNPGKEIFTSNSFNSSKMNLGIFTCNLINRSHCLEGRIDDALQLYNYLLDHTPSLDHKIYDLLTKALVNA